MSSCFYVLPVLKVYVLYMVTFVQVREKRVELEKLKTTFVKRASEFLRNYFSSLVDFMISDKSYFSQVILEMGDICLAFSLGVHNLISLNGLQRGQLKRPDHADLRYKCRTYARLLQHLKVLFLFLSQPDASVFLLLKITLRNLFLFRA